MSVREVLKYGNKTLKRVSRRVEKIDDTILDTVEDLRDTLKEDAGGIGLSAPQIGVLKRIILIDLKEEDFTPIVLINPKIIKKIGHEESVEGCLSYPGYEGIVIRPKKVIVTGLNLDDKEVNYTADGLLAKAFCHEIDHLDGILYMEKAKKIYKLDKK
ncbi:MAG: peptide deformylase [Clostridium sp.]|uniref:peptide deformylase n=1 Tax=Clostridium sp. TaxID=1506 RepID=UPI0025B99814|nr:peptide deformylase [Clostridium sp.]MCH3963886.1 peptide deformylase [Clostridium sp.]MCI1717005.1 peptide deformylase [Clostridium sp.]MCI1801276.1 peptide deformylase [Clostridium sp.]MCI1815122.1 peptide deformylase [Clostridium sp.]MCI1872094.1 peptide deformylase [Clostridium sp.]